jgi:hypothetical protein
MKKIFLLFVSLWSFHAAAQTYGTITLTSFPSGITGGATSNVNQVIDCQYNRNVTFYLAGTAGSATNTTMTVTVLPHLLSGSLVGTNSPYTFTLTIATNKPATFITNVDVGAVGWLEVTTAVAGANAVTNSSMVAALKPGN